MAKRGRKRKVDPYFGPAQEEAVKQYVACEDQVERTRIYNEHLREPLNKMVEYIIKTYKLYRKGMSFEQQHMDALGDVMMKADKFDGGKGKKAYSYYGTIIKRYVLGQVQTEDKNMKKYSSFDDVSSYLETKDDYQYEIANHDDFTVDKFMSKLTTEIQLELDDETPAKKLSENERKVGYALIDILDNWEDVLSHVSSGAKYNKIAILETMRNHTGLTTKDIRLAMRRYKGLYDILKIQGLDEGIY